MARGSSSLDAVQHDDPAGRTPVPGARRSGTRGTAPAAVATPRSWAAFAKALAGVLAVLEDEQVLILSQREGGGYVQAVADGDGGLRIEAVSNHYLEGSARHDRARTRRLRQLGWLPPTHAPGKTELTRRERRGSPNHYRDLAGEVDRAAAAGLLAATLREVYEVHSPGQLVYTAFQDAHHDILLPTLGIDRVGSSTPEQAAPAPRPPSGTGQPFLFRPENAERLRIAVLGTLKGWTGQDDLAFDDDGTLGLSRNDVSVLVRVAPDTPVVDLFSTVLYGVEPGVELYEAINELNNNRRFVVLTLMGPRVVACVSVDASPFVPDTLLRALTVVGELVESSRTELRPRFGGRATLEEDPAPQPDAGPPVVN